MQSNKTVKTITTVKEYNEQGNLVKETTTEVVEESRPDYSYGGHDIKTTTKPPFVPTTIGTPYVPGPKITW